MTASPMGVRDVLRIRDYRNLFAGQVVSDIGDGITLLLVLLVINDLTGSTFALALMAIAEAVPAFTVGLAAGVYVDRWNRRRVMLAADLLRAAIVLSFGLVQTAALVPLLYVLGFTQASIGSFFRPARGAMLPHIIPAEGLPAANSLAQGSQVVGGVIGAGIAGLLFGVFGSAPIGFAIDAATFLISFAFISRIAASAGEIRGEEHAAARNTGMLTSIRTGIDVVRGSRVLAGILMASAVTMLGLGAVNVLFVPLIVNELGVSPTWMAGIDLIRDTVWPPPSYSSTTTSSLQAATEDGGGAEGPALGFRLESNAPNPVTNATSFRFHLPAASAARLEIFDLSGRRVAVAADGAYPAGVHSVRWDRRNASGATVRPGLYLYRLTAGSFRGEGKMVLAP